MAEEIKTVLRHIANLWTLVGYPSKREEWSLDQKLDAIHEAGFDGVCWAGSRELAEGTKRRCLIFIGGMSSASASEFPRLLREQKDTGARHVNVQLADEDTLTPEALELVLALMKEGRRLGLEPAIEVHRDTCTETPEKTYALSPFPNSWEDATVLRQEIDKLWRKVVTRSSGGARSPA